MSGTDARASKNFVLENSNIQNVWPPPIFTFLKALFTVDLDETHGCCVSTSDKLRHSPFLFRS